MFSICIPRVSAHYDEVDVRDALNHGLDGEFVDKIDVRYTEDSRGTKFQVMFVHFLEKAGNEHTVGFFQRLEQNGEVKFYTGAVNRKTGERFYWKVRKIISKVPRVVHGPGMMSEEDEAKLKTKKAQQSEAQQVEAQQVEAQQSEAPQSKAVLEDGEEEE
jgi:hypothetical protein